MSQNSTDLKVVGADKTSAIVFSSAGTTPLPVSAGIAVTAKNTAGRVAVHGTVSGTNVVVDNPA